MYGNERADTRALDELEAILREVAEELAAWRARALRAEADLKERRPGAAARAADPGAEGQHRGHPPGSRREADLVAENDVLRRRVEAARSHVTELLSRLTFLEEQARNGGNGGAGGSRR